MSTDKNDKDQFKKYLAGKMSNEDAHAFEREVLNDPFAQEALEGLEGQSFENVSDDIKKLESQISQPKRVGFSLMNIAAVVSLLMISSLALWLIVDSLDKDEALAMESKVAEEKIEEKEVLENPDQLQQTDSSAFFAEEETIAEVVETEVQEVAVVAVEDLQSVQIAETQIDVNEAPPEIQTDALVADVVLDESAAALQSGAEFGAEDMTDAFADSDDEDVEIAALENSQLLDAVSASSKALASEETKSKRDEQLAQKRIDDPNSLTLEVASIREGLQISDTSEEIDLEIASALQGRTAGVPARESRRSANKSAATPAEDVYSGAQPINGTVDFKKYIDENLLYPETAKGKGIKGTVILELTISETGEIVSIDVKRSLGYGCDEEAIRLVREGPEWGQALRNNVPEQDKVTLRIRFKED